MRFARFTAAAVAAIGLVAAASVAFAASAPATTTTPASAFWGAVATKVGVPASTLESAVRSVLRQDRTSSHRAPRFRFGARRAGGLMVREEFVKAAATYLGMTPKSLLTELRSGKSLADVATASGKSVSGLEAALSTQATRAIDQMVQHVWGARSGRPTSTSNANTGSPSN